ncbi:MAG: class I SAM-dependent methyltransferase [Fibrobacteria bacterium]|nr:class I SAM-dependent methyltransferase [Fibrobacteria bacterium]
MVRSILGLARLALRDFSLRGNPTDPTPDYDRASETYDDYYTARLGAEAVRLLAEVPLATGARVVDIPCGTGCHTFEIARKVGSDGVVYAVDLSSGMLEKCRKKAFEMETRNVHCILADGTEWLEGQLPGSLDVVFCIWGLCYLDWKRFFIAARKALRPGGILAIIENRVDSLAEVSKLYQNALIDHPKALIRKVDLSLPSNAKSIASAVRREGFEIRSQKDGELRLDIGTGEELLAYLNRGGVSSGFVNAIDPELYPTLEAETIAAFDRSMAIGKPVPVVHRFSSCIATIA